MIFCRWENRYQGHDGLNSPCSQKTLWCNENKPTKTGPVIFDLSLVRMFPRCFKNETSWLKQTSTDRVDTFRPGVPNPWGHRPLLVHGQLGTGPHSRRWVVSQQANLHPYLQLLPITLITARAPPPIGSAGHQVLIGAWTLLQTVLARDLGCPLLMWI